MEKIIFQYYDKNDDKIVVIINEFEDILWKVNIDKRSVSLVIETWMYEEIIEDVADELYVSNSYTDAFLDYIKSEELELKINIYNENGEELITSRP